MLLRGKWERYVVTAPVETRTHAAGSIHSVAIRYLLSKFPDTSKIHKCSGEVCKAPNKHMISMSCRFGQEGRCSNVVLVSPRSEAVNRMWRNVSGTPRNGGRTKTSGGRALLSSTHGGGGDIWTRHDLLEKTIRANTAPLLTFASTEQYTIVVERTARYCVTYFS